MIRISAATAISLLLGPLSICSAQSALEAAQRGVAAFLREPAAKQKKHLEAASAAADEALGPLFAALRPAIAEVFDGKRVSSKSKLGKTKKAKRTAPAAEGAWRFPAAATYRYGFARIEPTLHSGGRNEKLQKLRCVPVELMLLGTLPDADLVVADVQARMDQDRSADDFMRFLELWRNGDESFYEALDRTAGTQDSVFFYDAMLGDYVSEFGRGKTEAAKQIKKSLAAAHDALHASFLRYRQYRAFREAVALSLVLPPDVPLPKNLNRYQEKGQGQYSLRQQVTMVLAVHGWDPRRVAALVTETARPLPAPLWSASYDPYPAWDQVFQGAMPEMISASGDTTKFLQAVEEQWLRQANALRVAARTALDLLGAGAEAGAANG
jgi:hypothetical protein